MTRKLVLRIMNLLWLTCLLFLVNPVFSQTMVTIEGFEGLTFTKSATSYIIAVTDSFTLHSMKITPKELSLSWDADSETFSLWGGAQINLTEEKMYVSLGNSDVPGIIISNDVLQDVNFGFTASFGLKGVNIIPDSLAFAWDKSENNYDIYGSLLIDIDGDTVDAFLGDRDNPGMEITDGTVEHINFGITADFSIKSLEIKPTNLTFQYDDQEDDYDIFGEIDIKIEDDSLAAILGEDGNPGIEIKDGSVINIDLGITTDFELKGLEIKTEALGFSWKEANNSFNLFGSVNIEMEEDTIGFSFGTMEEPGLVYANGEITSFNISTSDDLHFGGLEVKTENLAIEEHDDIYHISGKLYLKDMWSAMIDLGTGPGSGVTLDVSSSPTKFQIDQASFDLGNVDLGAITLKNLMISLADNSIDAADLSVEFPPGWIVSADMTLKNGTIASMDIDWEAENFEEAIELPGTGTVITKIEGGVFNLDDPHNFYFKGSMGLAMGGPFKIGDDEVAIVYIETDAKIDREELYISSDVKIGAYMDSDRVWHSVLGEGNLTIDLKWGDSYSLDGHLKIPTDPIIEADLEAKLSYSGAFNALIDVKLLVPESVPLIGGFEFGEADGVIHYDKSDPKSFAAGWVSVDLLFDTIKKGVRYNFKSKDFSVIGAKAISDISKTPAEPVINPPYNDPYMQSIYLTVDEPRPHFIQMKVKLDKVMSVNLRTKCPGALNTPFSPLYLVNGVDEMTESNVNYNMLVIHLAFYVQNKDEIIFYIMPPGYDTNSKARLTAGEYCVNLLGLLDADIVSYESHKMFDHPVIDYQNLTISTELRPETVSSPLNGVVLDQVCRWDVQPTVFNPDSAKINVLYSKDGQNGVLVESLYYRDCQGTFDNHAPMARIESPIIDELNPGDDLYLWAFVDDGVNAVVQTDIVKIDYNLPIQGKIHIAGEPDSAASHIGVNIFVQGKDGQWWPINDNDGKKTNDSGEFGFTQKLVSGSKIKLDVDMPHGYLVDSATIIQPDTPYTVDNNGGYNFGTISLIKTN